MYPDYLLQRLATGPHKHKPFGTTTLTPLFPIRFPQTPLPPRLKAHQDIMINRLHLPIVYRVTFLTIEPFLALLGAMHAHMAPASFLAGFVPPPASSSSSLDPALHIVFTYLAATYVLVAFTLAVVLRATSELRVWNAVLLGVLVCDVLHLYGSLRALGPDVFWNPVRWRGQDWTNLGLLWSMAVLRVCFLMGLGIELGRKGKVRS